MAEIWTVNDRDLRDLGFHIDRFNGPTDGVFVEHETTEAPGRYGEIPMSPEGKSKARDLSCRGHMEAASPAALEAAYDALKDWVSRGMCEIRTGLNASKTYHGWYRQASGDPVPPQLLRRWGSVALSFRCFDPLAYDRYERVITLSATPAQIPQGHGPLAGVIRAKGPSTSPLIITKRDHAGRPTGILTLGFAGKLFTLGANDRVEIVNSLGTITKYTAGVASFAEEFMLASSDFPLVIGKDESDRLGQSYATLEVSGLGSGGSAEYLYARTHE
jgi:hypothetical protein